jgi:hypothetical protein
VSEAIDPLLQEALPQRKTIEFASGPVIVRELLADEYADYIESIGTGAKDAAKRKEALAVIFSLAIIKEDGSHRFTVEQCRELVKTVRISSKVMHAIMELAGQTTAKKG